MEPLFFPIEVKSILEQKTKGQEQEKQKPSLTIVEDTLKGNFTSMYGVHVQEITEAGVYFDLLGNKYIKIR